MKATAKLRIVMCFFDGPFGDDDAFVSCTVELRTDRLMTSDDVRPASRMPDRLSSEQNIRMIGCMAKQRVEPAFGTEVTDARMIFSGVVFECGSDRCYGFFGADWSSGNNAYIA